MEGFISGILASVAVWPLETLRVQKQALAQRKISLFKTMHLIRTTQGIQGFYKGISFGCAASGFFFGTYFYFERVFRESLGVQNKFFSGYLSAGVSSTLVNVLHVYKTKAQAQVITNVNFGNLSFYGVAFRGLKWTWMKNTELGLIMHFRPKLQNYLMRKQDNNVLWSSNVLSTFLIKWAATTLTYPLDTARVLARTENLSTKDIISRLIESPKNAYRGYILYSLRSVPATVITFCTYDFLSQRE